MSFEKEKEVTRVSLTVQRRDRLVVDRNSGANTVIN